MTVVGAETMGEKDPLLAKLLAAATAGASPVGRADPRQPLRIVLDPDERPVGKGTLCAQTQGFNLPAAPDQREHGAEQVAGRVECLFAVHLDGQPS